MIIGVYFILIAYAGLIIWLYFGGIRIPEFKSSKTDIPTTHFSIVVPFRNEAKHLPELLMSLKDLKYPKNQYEILLINDASSDNSEPIINQFRSAYKNIDIRLIQNERHSNSPKKDAIQTAIIKAKHKWIITTDADCILPELWLHTFNSFIAMHAPKMIVAPVTYYNKSSFLNQFQWCDMMSLQGATLGGFGINHPFLCNGANLAYKKTVFLEVEGYNDNNTIASGDDIFLLEKTLKKHPDKVLYLKSPQAVVKTHAQSSFSELINQRKRWAAKTNAYQNPFSKFVGLLVITTNMLLLSLLLLMLFESISINLWFIFSVVKISVDFLLIYKSAVFFMQTKALKSYPLAALVYPLFACWIACSSVLTTYTWKDRSFAK